MKKSIKIHRIVGKRIVTTTHTVEELAKIFNKRSKKELIAIFGKRIADEIIRSKK